MSLRLKFGILLGLLGLAVLLTLGACWLAFSSLQTEVREPLRGMTAILVDLAECKRGIEKARLILQPIAEAHRANTSPDAPPSFQVVASPVKDPAEFDRAIAIAKVPLSRADLPTEQLEDFRRDWQFRSGVSSLRNLNSRIDTAQSLGHAYISLAARNDDSETNAKLLWDSRVAAYGALSDLHDLIERIESRILIDSQSAMGFTADFRTMLMWMLAWAFLIVLLTIALGFELVRRWILRPVAELRTAAARIASGDLAYRIPLAQSAAGGDELARLGAEVNHMAGMVKTMQDERVEQERLAALGEMIRRLAHNLRNPLAGIRGLAEITRAELPALGPQAADIKENQDRIITSVDRFEKWLNELLSATKPLAVDPEPTAVVPWLKGLVDAHRPSAQTSGVELILNTAAAPLEASFDARHLEYALSAILSNALEATSSPQARGETPTGGRVVVEVLIGAQPQHNGQSGQTWAIRITDQGYGIPPDLRDSIFRPYFTTKHDGNGIGLAIALQVVKAHGGQIQVESPFPSRLNGSGASQSHSAGAKGTCFTISLPVHGPVLANDSDGLVARNGRSGAPSGQDPRH